MKILFEKAPKDTEHIFKHGDGSFMPYGAYLLVGKWLKMVGS